MKMTVYAAMVLLLTTATLNEAARNCAPVITAPTCTSGWTNHQGKCYRLVLTPSTWGNAKTKCGELGAKLAKIPSVGVVTMLGIPSGNNAWVGGNDVVAEETWVWDGDGSSVDGGWSGWLTGYPRVSDTENCMVTTPEGTWYDMACTDMYHGYICEM